MTISVLTLVRDRNPQLRNLVRGLARSIQPVDELVVAWMGGADPAPVLGDVSCEVRIVRLQNTHERLPLASARNAAAAEARSSRLIFLDVDCIPGSHLVAAYDAALSTAAGLLMGPVRYLPAGTADDHWDEDALERAGVEHPGRRAPRGSAVIECGRYELFWSLSFAVHRETFAAIGGFDQNFSGYGGEDTDFAFAARAAGIPLAWVPTANAYHQDHVHCDPPLQHLDDIVANAERFKSKWDTWPMENWLGKFADAGYVSWDDGGLKVLRRPSVREVEAARRSTFPGRGTSPS